MWFLLGIISISICVCFEYWRRHLAKWKPEGNCYGLEYRHAVYKSKIKSLYLGINCIDTVNFSIKRQSWLDNVFKSIGVSNEFETKDPEFDNSFYLIADNQALQDFIASSDIFRLAIENIMRRERLNGLKPKAIHCRNGRIWCVFSVSGSYERTEIEKVSHSLQRYFSDAASSLNKALFVKARRLDPFVVKAALFLAISSGVAINGVVQWVRSSLGHFPLVLENTQIYYDALKYSVIIVLILLATALFSLRRSARTHIVLLELLIVGSIGIFLSTAIEMRDINMEWDRSPPQLHTVDVINKYESKSGRRRKRTHYYVVVKDWRCDCGNYRLGVPRNIYHAIGGNSVGIIQRPGYLGYPWISQLIPNPQRL